MSFGRVAPVYERLERLVYGDDLQRARIAHLGKGAIAASAASGTVLLVGDGDGRFLQALVECCPAARIDVVESSAVMVELSRRRVGDQGQVRYHQENVNEFEPERDGFCGYDLIVTHFFLDCFEAEELGQLLVQFRRWLVEGGSWLIADFQVPRGRGWRHFRGRILLAVMYRFFAVTSGLCTRHLVDPEPGLRQSGLHLAERKVYNAGFIRSDHWRA